MVSRGSDDSVVSRFAHGTYALFQTWRVLLTDGASATARTGRAASRVTRHLLSLPRRVLSLLVRAGDDTRTPLSSEDARAAAWVGILAMLLGTAAAMALARAGNTDNLAATLVVVLWTPGRYAVMRLAAEPQTEAERRAVPVAWGLGLLPFIISFWPLGRLAAWAASAVIVYRSLRRDFDTRDTRWIWSWTFGIEFVATLAVWLLRNLHVAALFLGR